MTTMAHNKKISMNNIEVSLSLWLVVSLSRDTYYWEYYSCIIYHLNKVQKIWKHLQWWIEQYIFWGGSGDNGDQTFGIAMMMPLFTILKIIYNKCFWIWVSNICPVAKGCLLLTKSYYGWLGFIDVKTFQLLRHMEKQCALVSSHLTHANILSLIHYGAKKQKSFCIYFIRMCKFIFSHYVFLLSKAIALYAIITICFAAHPLAAGLNSPWVVAFPWWLIFGFGMAEYLLVFKLSIFIPNCSMICQNVYSYSILLYWGTFKFWVIGTTDKPNFKVSQFVDDVLIGEAPSSKSHM